MSVEVLELVRDMIGHVLLGDIGDRDVRGACKPAQRLHRRDVRDRATYTNKILPEHNETKPWFEILKTRCRLAAACTGAR